MQLQRLNAKLGLAILSAQKSTKCSASDMYSQLLHIYSCLQLGPKYKIILLLKTTLKMALGVQFDIWGWLKAPSKRFFISRYHDLQVRVSASSSTSDATGLGLPSVNTTSPYSSNNASKSSSSSWLKSTSYNRTKFISLIPIVQFCPHLPLLSMGRLNMHTSHKGVWTPQLLTAFLVQIAKEFSFFFCYTYCKNTVWQNPQTLKLGTSPNPSPLVAAAENIPQVLPCRHQFENLRPCVVDVRCEEPDTVVSWEKRWAQDGWRKDWYVSSVHSD